VRREHDEVVLRLDTLNDAGEAVVLPRHLQHRREDVAVAVSTEHDARGVHEVLR
jgi:hypothetical protein